MNIRFCRELVSEFFYGVSVQPYELDTWQQLVVSGSVFVGLVILAAIIYYLIRKVLLRVFTKLVKLTKNQWDDELLSSNLFRWLALIVPAAILWHLSPSIFEANSKVSGIGATIKVISEICMVILSLMAVHSILNVSERIFQRYEVSRELPIKSFFQVIKIILTMIGIIFVVSTVIGKSPLLLFSGLGAMTAILLLIFKDSILGFVAGIQLSANKLVACGDWIEMPKFGADGEVLEVALTSVKVRNWDKTITSIPTYSLISDSFKNWRGMSQSGVRRIKRSLFLDMGTVRFLDDEMLARMRNIYLLEHYLDRKLQDIKEWNSERKVSSDDLINARAMTNIGTFRAYVNEYLKSHPSISKSETILVRLLQPTEHGLPIEIYAFTTDNSLMEYERIQSDIFDHLLAVISKFGLRVFQSPSGADVLTLGDFRKKCNEV